MVNTLISAHDIFLDRISTACKKFGLNHVMAQLYAILYFSGKPLSLNDMMDRLKISKASTSINIRALERYGAVKRVWVKGSRKDYYEADGDIYKVVTERIRSMAKSRLSEVNDMIKSSYAMLGSVSPQNDEEAGSIKAFSRRLEKLDAIHKQAQSLFELLDSGLLQLAGIAAPSRGEPETERLLAGVSRNDQNYKPQG